MTERRRFLDEDFLEMRLALESIMDLLRPMTVHQTSALPQRLRTRLATCVIRLSQVRRELGRRPEALLEERQREDERER